MPKVVVVFSIIIPIAIFLYVASNYSKMPVWTTIVILVVCLGCAIACMVIPGLMYEARGPMVPGFIGFIICFILCGSSLIVRFGTEYASKIISQSDYESTKTTKNDSIAQIPADSNSMQKEDYDKIVAFLESKKDLIKAQYEDHAVSLEKRRQQNKAVGSFEDGGANAIYKTEIQQKVDAVINTRGNSYYVWHYEDWDALTCWDESDSVKFYTYGDRGFIKSTYTITDDTFCITEYFMYTYYNNYGIIEKDEYRWIVSPSTGSTEANVYDYQLRVLHHMQ